jgi:hypothetical protein
MNPDPPPPDPDRLAINDEEILDEIFLDMIGLTHKDLDELRGHGDETWGRKTLDQIAYEQGKISIDQRDTLYRAFLRRRVDTLRERLLGARLGSYQIVEEIASGGMGIVFKGRQESPMFTREVAIKFMLSGPEATDDERERFVDEVRHLAGLTHPNLVPIFDSGIEGNLYYFTMELVDGVSLSDPASAGELDLRRKAAIIRDVARALAYLHGNGVVHRDVKPGNIMLDRQGTARLLDFGIAQFSGDARRRGIQAGTPHYMAPEIIHPTGGFGAIGPGADIYALGSVLYFLLYGREVFAGEAGIDGVLARTLESPPRFPRGGTAKVPTALERVVARCLEKRVEDRYRSAAELADALDRVLDRRSLLPWYVAAAAAVAVAGALAFVAAGRGAEEGDLPIDLASHREKLAELADFPGEARALAEALDGIAAGAPGAEGTRALREWEDAVARLWREKVEAALAAAEAAKDGLEPEGTVSVDSFVFGRDTLKEASELPPGRKAWKALLAARQAFGDARKFAEEHRRKQEAERQARTEVDLAAGRARSELERVNAAALERCEEARGAHAQAAEAFASAETHVRNGALGTALELYGRAAAGFRTAADLAEQEENRRRAELARLGGEIERRARQLDDADLVARLVPAPGAAAGLATALDGARRALGIEDAAGCARRLEDFDRELAAATARAGELEAGARTAEGRAVAARERARRVLERDGAPRFPDVAGLAASWRRAEGLLRAGEDRRGEHALEAARQSFDDAAAEFERYDAAVRALLDEMVWVDAGSVGEESVPGFWIDLHEVTVEEYAAFLDDVGANGHARCCESDRSHEPLGWEEQRAGPDRPVVGISLDRALAFARWAGKALPSPAMWRLAAGRGADGRLLAYPYGDAFDGARTHCPARARSPADLAPAISFPEGASGAGCLHMSGNAWEWAAEAAGEGWLLGGSIAVGEWHYLRTDTRVRPRAPGDLRFAGFRCVLTAVRTHDR